MIQALEILKSVH